MANEPTNNNPVEVMRRIMSSREWQEHYGATGVDHESFDRAAQYCEVLVTGPAETGGD